jgi:hypothetical protein
MADYSAPLNRDQQLVKTAAEYNPAIQRWVNTVGWLGDAGVVLTTTPLGANGTYTQQGIDRLAPGWTDRPVLPIGQVRGFVWADRQGTLYLEESENNSTWNTTASVSVSAGTTTELPWTSLTKRYFRFRYVNGATAQGSFVLVQQCAGLAVPNVQLTGSSIEDSQAIPMTQAQKDIIAKAIDDVVNTIGLDYINVFLPCNEKSGTVLKDLIRPEKVFDVSGATLGIGNYGFGSVVSFDGVNDLVLERPSFQYANSSSYIELNSGSLKLAQRLPFVSCMVTNVILHLQIVGSLPSAKLVVKLVRESNGVPGTTEIAVSSELPCSVLSDTNTNPKRRHFLFSSPTQIRWSAGINESARTWFVLEYSNATGVDTSNYVKVFYDTTGVSEPMAQYNGTNWTVNSSASLYHMVYDDYWYPAVNSDVSIITGLGNVPETTGAKTLVTIPSIGMTTGGYTASAVFFQSAHNILSWWTLSGYFGNYLSNYGVTVVTSSYAASTGKNKLYINGRLVKTSDGTANTGLIEYRTFGILFGVGLKRFDLYYDWYGSGYVGPFILCNRILSSSEVSKVSNAILQLRKYRVGV